MIRLIQRRLIVPRGDTGTFSIPVLAGKDSGDTSIFTIFSPLTHRKIFEKVMENSDGVLKMDLTHGDTVNLPVGDYVWDIKFYTDPVFVDGKLVSGTEVDSYYSAFQLPICEIRETGDNLLIADDAPDSKLAPDQINYIDAAIIEIHSSMDAAVTSAAEASTSATNAETSASAAAASAQTAQDSEDAAVAAKLATQAAASDAANSASMAAISANNASNSATAASNSATNAASSASEAAESVSAVQATQAAAESAQANAATQASNASASAAAAANSASAASTSQQAAAASATAALTSQQAAAASETNAANSATAAAASAQQAAATAQAIHEEIPTKVSQLENDSGYLTQHQDISMKANSADLAAVATSGDYSDLTNTPYIPTKTSDLTNDSNYPVDANYVHTDNNYTTEEKSKLAGIAAGAEVNVNADWNATTGDAAILNKPTKVSDFQNDTGFITSAALPTKVSDLTDDSGHYTKPANGIPATDMTSGVQTSLGLADTAYQKPNNGIPASDLASGVIPSVPVQDVQIKNTSILNNGVANIPLAANGAVGLVQGNNTYGTAITAAGDIMIYRADDSAIKNGNGEYKPIVPYTEHQAVFYGLAKAAGDTTQRESQNNVGIYTSSAQSAIQAMLDVPSTSSVASSIASAIGNVHQFNIQVVQSLPTQDIQEHTVYFVPKTGETNDVYDEYIYVNNGWEMIGNTQIDLSNYATKSEIPNVPVQDVQIDGTTILNNNIANIPLASTSNFGLVKAGTYGVSVVASGAAKGTLAILAATESAIKAGNDLSRPIVPGRQEYSIFYGLAKAAGDTTQSQSDNAVGTYTTEAKTAILNMFGLQLATDTEIQNIINGGAGA